jgi:hypothetical protein
MPTKHPFDQESEATLRKKLRADKPVTKKPALSDPEGNRDCNKA